ncbi:hypothetical protein AAH991_34770 [Microbispora sp. ZYX-F-249]|uniref:indole-3-glycerol-phosphate synthase n=1 Tax=Microbispora maris TaxID=3144104 RepID=A0ABV0B091_9ACTN
MRGRGRPDAGRPGGRLGHGELGRQPGARSRPRARTLIQPTAGQPNVADGAAAMSVLSDRRHFGGHSDDLRAVCEVGGVPLPRKVLVPRPCRRPGAAVAGADPVLLIVAVSCHRRGSPGIGDGVRSPGR